MQPDLRTSGCPVRGRGDQLIGGNTPSRTLAAQPTNCKKTVVFFGEPSSDLDDLPGRPLFPSGQK